MTFTRRKFFTFSGSVAALSLFSQAEAMPLNLRQNTTGILILLLWAVAAPVCQQPARHQN